jgi:ketosteroid isomerase-like protein
MSQENVEIVRRLNDAFNRRDFERLFQTLDPDVEWIPIMAVLEGRVYRGHAGVREWIEHLSADWEVFETHQEEFRLVGDRVLILGHWRAIARGSGIELRTQPASWVVVVQDGKVVRLQTYTDRKEALEAVGLSEQDAHADS